jgi:hypothetical protein
MSMCTWAARSISFTSSSNIQAKNLHFVWFYPTLIPVIRAVPAWHTGRSNIIL